MEIMKELFLGIETEYYENNNATNIADLFNEMLRAIPLDKIVQNDTLALFKNELEELVNSRQLTKHDSPYLSLTVLGAK